MPGVLIRINPGIHGLLVAFSVGFADHVLILWFWPIGSSFFLILKLTSISTFNYTPSCVRTLIFTFYHCGGWQWMLVFDGVVFCFWETSMRSCIVLLLQRPFIYQTYFSFYTIHLFQCLLQVHLVSHALHHIRFLNTLYMYEGYNLHQRF
jgi:hypothetical protein